MSNAIENIIKIPFFWTAFYSDETCLPQFDLDTGEKHLFKEIDQTKLIKFGLFPIPKNIAQKLGPPYYSNSRLPHFILTLKPNQRLIGGIREETQQFYSYSQCLLCGFNWQWIPLREDNSIGDAGLPIYGSEKYSFYINDNDGKKIFEVICPKCGAKNDLKCPTCNEWWNKVETEDSVGKPEKERKYRVECPKCKSIKIQKTKSMENYKVENIFLLGYQTTLPDGSNEKVIMRINRDGEIELGVK